MADLIVRGGKKLNGEITPAGNKNAALPILCATLLTDDTITLKNFPDLLDVNKLIDLLISLGSEINWDKENKTITINNSNLRKDFGEEGFPLGMRGAVLLLGPLAVRMDKIEVKTEIGGCSLGIRELDPHIDVLRSLGAEIKTNHHLIIDTSKGLRGGSIWPDYMSVTTTENFIMAASKANGISEMTNAASEPHVQALCNFLNQMGAKIDGIGSCKVVIEGVENLHGTEFTIPSDHHEIATLLALGAMTKGYVRVKNSEPEFFPLINRSFEKLGVNIKYNGDTAYVKGNQKLKVLEPYTKNMLQKIEAAPWPYFPADLMPLLMALAVKADGSIMFWNKLYEGGFFWIPEMIKFGAEIVMCDPHRAIIFGNKPLQPATVNAPDIIRATVALLMVALTIDGESRINNADTIKRAHPDFVENLNKLGADIEWVE
ncbi:MAG: UDP-N-acetylglucosamine 1-carboxyvinyltransferase [Candidatus Dojkabacteria bacterium]|nr:UDP-N-acetylglucosamine 1-carboxyvinyltransferase [Candidatus Dojkabacteria bacterium]